MKKHYYTAPECEIVRINLGNQILILQGSILGEEGEAGAIPEVDLEIEL